MIILTYVLGIFFLIGGLGSCAMANGAVHEIGGLVSLLIGFGLIGVGVVIEKLSAILKELRISREIYEANVPGGD